MPVLESACVRALICTGEPYLGRICSIPCSRQHRTVAPPTQGGFAGILAALSGPAQKSVPAWNDEGLEEDVATLSYEHALRTHARYRPPQARIHPGWPELPPLAEPVCGNGGEPNQRKPRVRGCTSCAGVAGAESEAGQRDGAV